MIFRCFLLALCALPLLSLPARGDLTVTQKFEGLGQDAENTSRFKDGKTRVDTSPGTSLIVDLKTGETISLNHPQKTYFKITGEVARAALESLQQSQAARPDKPSPLVATDKKETLGGYTAQEYTCTVGSVKMALWLTKDLPDYPQALREMSAGFKDGPLAAMLQNDGFDLSTLPGFPVRTVLEIPPSQILTRTVTAVSTKPLPETDFQVPADYTEVTTRTLTPPAASQALPAALPQPSAAP